MYIYTFRFEIDFGIHVSDNKTVYKTIIVKNTGSTPAPYRIDYQGKHPIGFSPQSAVVQPNSSISVEVILIHKKEKFILFLNIEILGIFINIIS